MAEDPNIESHAASAPAQVDLPAAAYLAWRDAKVRRVLADKTVMQSAYAPLNAVAARHRRPPDS